MVYLSTGIPFKYLLNRTKDEAGYLVGEETKKGADGGSALMHCDQTHNPHHHWAEWKLCVCVSAGFSARSLGFTCQP